MEQGRRLPAVGDWLGRSFSATWGRWPTVTLLVLAGWLTTIVAMALVFLLPLGVIWIVKGREFLLTITSMQRLQYVLEDETLGTLVKLVYFVAVLVALRIGAWFALALVQATIDARTGFRRALSLARPRALAFLGLSICQQIAVNVGLLLLIIPGLILAIWFVVAPQVFAAEGLGIFATLSRSRELVTGRFWPVLGRVLLLGLIASLIMIVPLAGWVIGPTLALVAMATLHQDLRATR